MKNGNIIPDFEKLKNSFSERLKSLRIERTPDGRPIRRKTSKEIKKIPVEQIAHDTEMSEKMYRKWEDGDLLKHLPAGEKLVTMANYHGVSVDYLLGLSDFQTPEKDFIGKEIGLTDGAIDKLRQMKQADQTTALQIISDLLTAPDFDEILACFLDLYTNALQQKDMNLLKSTVSENEMSALVKSLDTSDIIEKSEKYRMIEWYLNEYKTKAAALVNNGQFLKATYADISRLSWNLAESYYKSKAGE